MAEQQLFNKVVYINRIKRAGITEHEARAHAEAIEQALHEGIATDIELVRNDLQQLEHQINAPSAT